MNLPPRASAKRLQAPRLKTKARGYGGDWRKLRSVHLREHPLCEHCKRAGVATLATDVDHIRPIAAGGGRLDRDNLQSLCKACHSRKTLRENIIGVGWVKSLRKPVR